jgi:hypothetical protein
MKVYLAAMLYNDFRAGSRVYERLTETEQRAVDAVQYILDSYHYINNQRMVNRIRSTGRKIFLDSGAFSAFTQKVEMDLEKYCDYIKANSDFIEHVDGQPLASVLDEIGDADGTWRNQDRMEKLGVCPLPCYHFGEDPRVLEYYTANYKYITIGGMVPISSAQLKVWLDRIWADHLTDPDGSPKIKVHGFGLTSVPLMARYPWYSVDSSSWVQLGGMGNIFIPQFGMLAVSKDAPQRHEAGKHLDNLTKPEFEVVAGFIEGLGFDLTRKVFNMISYGSFVADSGHKRFLPPQPSLF